MEDSIDLNEKENMPTKPMIQMIFGCLLLGILFNILFYNKVPGISYPIFVILFYGFFIWHFRKKISFKGSFEWFLTIPIIALSLTYLVFSNGLFRFLNFMGIPLLIAVQTILLTKRNRYSWYIVRFLKDILVITVERTLSNIPKPIKIAGEFIKRKMNAKKYGVANKVFIGLVLSIPLVFIIIALLSSADQIFGYFMGNIFHVFEKIDIENLIPQLILVFIVSLALASYMISLSEDKKVENIEQIKERDKAFDPVVLTTILVLINAVYLLFTFVQFSYLFGSIHLALPPNFTYADYARRGFFELNLVTLINLGIVLLSINLTKSGGIVIDRITRILNSILIICTFVMLISAFFRMSMYEAVYGYTYLRILTHAFMVFIFVLLVVALFKIWRNKISLLKSYIVISIIAYMIVNYINIDQIIVRQNIQRYYKTGQIDVDYLASVSYDTTPYLINLAKEKNNNVASKIVENLKHQKEALLDNTSWQSFNISESRARRMLGESLNLK